MQERMRHVLDGQDTGMIDVHQPSRRRGQGCGPCGARMDGRSPDGERVARPMRRPHETRTWSRWCCPWYACAPAMRR